MDSRLRKRRKLLRMQRLATHSAPLQPQAVQESRRPRNDITEVFKGQMRETDVEVTFKEEHTWLRVAVQKATLRHSEETGKKARSKEIEAQLHNALVAKHKAESLLRRRQAGEGQRQAELRKHLPRSTADLKVLSTEASGKLKYGYEDNVVEVTPRKLRDGGQAQDKAAPARLRETTPERALKKLQGKIRRRHEKMWRGEEEPVVARAAGRMGTGRGEEPSPALARLDDPVPLQRLQEYFEFLQRHRLHCCATCDEE